MTVFTLIPIVWGFLLSLSHAQNTIKVGHFIGVRNYADLLTDEAFLRSLVTILVFRRVYRPDHLLRLARAGADGEPRCRKGARSFRTVFFIPSAVSYVAASLDLENESV